MDRIISLSVGTHGAEDYFSIFQDVSELARNLGEERYVSVSATMIGDEPGDDEDEVDKLYYDEDTLMKVRKILRERGLSNLIIDEIINDLLNAGILFRERPKAKVSN